MLGTVTCPAVEMRVMPRATQSGLSLVPRGMAPSNTSVPSPNMLAGNVPPEVSTNATS